MERYKYIGDDINYQVYLRSLGPNKIGEGSEGQAFLLPNNYVVKIFNGPSKPLVYEEDKDKIIMAQDYNVPSFLLPTQLIITDNRIVGYVARFFPRNVLKFKAPYNGDINDININRLLQARETLISDTRVLTDNQVRLNDLDFNLLFDNRRFGVVDTFSYHQDSSVTSEDNVALIDEAILRELHYHDIGFKPDYSESLEQNLRRIRY